MKPLIGIPAHPTLQERNHTIIHSCGERYLKSIEKAGGIPVIIPITEDAEAIERFAQMCDGFLIPGGIDVNPMTYGEDPHPLLQMCDLTYDRFETALIQRIDELGKPMMGICRGIQIINTAFGGTLFQDVSLQAGEIMKHQQSEMSAASVCHKINIEKGTLLHEMYGDELYTNSFHHQSLKKIGSGLRVSAKTADGTVEAIEGTGSSFLLAVQWHPECFISLADNPMMKMFDAFIDACRK